MNESVSQPATWDVDRSGKERNQTTLATQVGESGEQRVWTIKNKTMKSMYFGEISPYTQKSNHPGGIL